MQIITVCFVLLAPPNLSGWEWLRVLVPMLIVAILMAFWFNTLSCHLRSGELERLKEVHAKEREKLKVNAERAKHRITKETQKQIAQEIRRTTAKANFKVGAAVAGVVAAGAFLLMTQFLTLGLLMLTAAGGTAGGYVLRIRQERRRFLASTAEENSQKLPRVVNPATKEFPVKDPATE